LIAPSSTDHPLYDNIVDSIRTVYDPEIPVNIFDLGLIYTVDINEDSEVKIAMTLTAPGCPVAGEMPGWVAEAIEPLPGVKHVDVELVWEPPWGMDMMSDEARLYVGSATLAQRRVVTAPGPSYPQVPSCSSFCPLLG
jgi:FeS assembly SUF system protein